MAAAPTTALLMRCDKAASRATAAALRRLGFAVAEFGDESHLYASAIRFAIAPEGDRRFVIIAEPTGDVVRDLEVLRSAHWPTPLVLVGPEASPAMARRLGAACLPCERPTPGALRRAIAAARDVSRQ
jgi:hypothetical protein